MIIDISEHQNPSRIDYKRLCKQLRMAIIRVQYGSKKTDLHYVTHIQEMKKHGIPFGVYAWVRGISEADMVEEAKDFYDRAKDYNPLFYVLDVEEKSMDNMRAGINAYVGALRNLTGKKIGAYIAHHRYTEFNLDTRKFDFVWIPHYGKNDGTANSEPSFPCDLHQYTDRGRLEGYGGYLDLNRLTGTKPLEFFTQTTASPTDLQLIKISLHGKLMEVEGMHKNGTNYIPVRFLEKLGYNIGWEGQQRLVTIEYK